MASTAVYLLALRLQLFLQVCTSNSTYFAVFSWVAHVVHLAAGLYIRYSSTFSCLITCGARSFFLFGSRQVASRMDGNTCSALLPRVRSVAVFIACSFFFEGSLVLCHRVNVLWLRRQKLSFWSSKQIKKKQKLSRPRIPLTLIPFLPLVLESASVHGDIS